MAKNLYHIDNYGKKELIASNVKPEDIRQRITAYLKNACVQCSLYSWEQDGDTWYDAGTLRAFFLATEGKDA